MFMSSVLCLERPCLALEASLQSGKYLFQEHQISAGQLSAESFSTETLYCLTRNRELII